MTFTSPTLFTQMADQPDEAIALDVAALLIGEWEYEWLDVSHYLDRLDDIAEEAMRLRDGMPDDEFAGIRALNQILFEELAFRGNQQDYYDPRNSFLHEVLDRRLGIPISLSVVYMEVARRMDIPLAGVSFPGHFLVRYDCDAGTLLIDPYHQGRTLDTDDLQVLLDQTVGEEAELTPEMLEPVDKRQILFRMLANLAGIYATWGDAVRSIEVLERMLILYPDNDRIADEIDRLREHPDEVH